MATLIPAHAFAAHGEAESGSTLAPPPGARSMRCRRIARSDLDGLAALLERGFPERSRASWTDSLKRLFDWTEARGLPGSGLMLDAGGLPVGVLLTVWRPDGRRCNLSSWYADEAYRRYASMLVNVAVKDKAVTYINVSSRRHTWPIIEAQGFRRYADGVFAAVPVLSAGPGERVQVVAGELPEGVAASPDDVTLMADHAALGCVTLWCVLDGRARPFIFSRRTIRHLPVAQLVYCEPDTDWRRVGRPLGWQLLKRGLVLMLLDADGAVEGLGGHFLEGRMPKYVRGPEPQRCGDLTYTECALFGT